MLFEALSSNKLFTDKLLTHLLLTFAATIFLVVSGCDQSNLNGSAPPNDSDDAKSENQEERDVIRRFDVDLKINGAIKPGKPVHFEITARSELSTDDAVLTLAVPEATITGVNKKPLDADEQVRFQMGTRIEPLGTSRRSFGPGQLHREKYSIRILEPGYYRVVATANAPEASVSHEGTPVDNFTSVRLWLWISEDGGQITKTFDRSLFPEGARQQPGPLSYKDEPASLLVIPENSKKGVTSKGGDDVVSLSFSYYAEGRATYLPVEDLRLSTQLIDQYDGDRLDQSNEYTGSTGVASLECYPSDYSYEYEFDAYTDSPSVLKNGTAFTLDADGISASSCGRERSYIIDSERGYVFDFTQRTVDKSLPLFGSSNDPGPMGTIIRSDGGQLLQKK